MTAEKNRPPQWWSAPEALAWLTYGQHQAVYLVQRAIIAEDDSGNRGAEHPDLLAVPSGEPTPWTPAGMLPTNSGGAVEGLRALERFCRERRLSAEGRLDGIGPVQPVPLEDWRDGKLIWRVPGGGRAGGRTTRLFLDIPGGRSWGGLHFRRDELEALWRGLEEIGATTHSYSTREEAEAAEAALGWWPEAAAEGDAQGATTAGRGNSIDDARHLAFMAELAASAPDLGNYALAKRALVHCGPLPGCHANDGGRDHLARKLKAVRARSA